MKKKNLLIACAFLALSVLTLYSFKAPQKKADKDGVVGTIITSVLDYDHFTRINGDPTVINPKVSKWVPADGRQIPGSKLSELTQMQNAPDLRGRFLRGLNTIYSNGQPALSIATADEDDPNSNRKPGDYQGDIIKKHSHEFSHMIQVAPTEPHSGPGGFKHSPAGSEAYNNYSVTGENPDGGSETRPKNVSVYYYVKIN